MIDPTSLFLDTVAPIVVDRVEVPSRAERRLPTPEPFRVGATGAWLEAMTGDRTSLWRHQALSLSEIAAGKHLVLSTGTGSGKSLPFQAAAIHALIVSDGATLVFYPQKALGGDQLVRWQRALQLAGFDPSLAAEINGDVAMSRRDEALEKARILLVTPDVAHAWLMRHIGSPSAQAFAKRLKLVVIDEAHTNEGVFGSNSAFLYRRLHCAAARHATDPRKPFQYIAATATIADPLDHMQKLTGCSFVAVEEVDNGAPYHGVTLLHIDGPAHGKPAEKMLADTVKALASKIAPYSVIGFADSRQGVERTARAVGDTQVLPYRSGYEASDRRDIEAALRRGDLRGVISTSALELGVDIPSFRIGLNMGVPQSIKAGRQRLGRVGRGARAVFAVQAPPSAFAKLGMSLADFTNGKVEASHLYLGNRLVHFRQARCLVDELCPDNGRLELPDCVDWPAGFEAMFAAAQPGAVRARDLDHVAAVAGDCPQLAFPLRRMSDMTYVLRLARGTSDKIGTIEIDKAMRETYPGATYYHRKKPYRVVEWRTRSYEQVIVLEPGGNGGETRPMLRTEVAFSLEEDALIDDRHRVGASGSLAEVRVGISESVEGYTLGGNSVPYREACKVDPRLSRKQREYSSTGILLRIDAPWFKGSGDDQVAARRLLARALTEMLCRTESIAQSDVRSVHTGIAASALAGPRKVDDAIVIFDSVPGGLRLTSELYTALPDYLDRLSRGAAVAGEDALISGALVDQVSAWHASLNVPLASAAELPNNGEDLIVFAPGSDVGLRVRGALIHRKLIEPQLVSVDDVERLMYRYEAGPGIYALVAHDRCEPVGHDWRRMHWNPVANELREITA